MSEQKNNQPKSKTRVGVISVTTWEKNVEIKGEQRTILNHVPEISYKDKNDEWQTGKSYNTNDLPKLILCLQKEYEKAQLQE